MAPGCDAAQPQSAGAQAAARYYDAVGRLWLWAYGNHVHVGLYDDPAARDRPPWGDAQLLLVQELLRMSGLATADKLLDIGCGHGATACYLANQLGCSAVGINISPFQVRHATSLAAARGLAGRTAFVVADGAAPPFADGSFDVVVAIESSAYMPDQRAFTQQLARLLAPGGVLIWTDFCCREGPLSAADARTLAAIDRAFHSAGSWCSAPRFQQLLEGAGLAVTAEADWSGRIRGFWELGWLEVALRRDGAAEAAFKARRAGGNAAAFVGRALQMLGLMLGPCVKHGMVQPAVDGLRGMLRLNAAMMRRAFRDGTLQYRAMIAVKPPVGGAAAAS